MQLVIHESWDAIKKKEYKPNVQVFISTAILYIQK